MTLVSNGPGNFVPYRFTYTNAAARTGDAGLAAGDVGSIALQLDDGTLWRLTATTPTWAPVAPTSGITVREQDGSPSVAGVSTLEFATGSVVLDLTGGAVRVTPPSGGGGGGLYSASICVADEKASGTISGTFTNGAWRTRDLNTERTDSGGHASLASNQLTLAAGTYDCLISAPAYHVDYHQARLRDITNGATLLMGTSEISAAADLVATRSVIVGSITLAGSTVLEVQHQCLTTFSSGFGATASFGTEVFTVAQFWKRA